jgi:hypothetical protein
MKITVVVQQITDLATAYSLFNYVRHVVAAGNHGSDSKEYLSLPKDSDLDGAGSIARFSSPSVLSNLRVRYADNARTEYRAIFHFTGEHEGLWRGTALCMSAFSSLNAVIIAFEPGQPITLARVFPGTSEEITTRTFPAMLADQLEQEFVGTEDELDILKISSEEVLAMDREGFVDAHAR